MVLATTMQIIKRDWNLYNLRLVNRGRPSNYLLPAVENRENDLKVMNKGKVGRPYQYSNVEIFAAYAIKCIFKLGYREASGIVEDYERQYGTDNTPNFRTIQWRIEKLRKDIISISIHEESKDMVDIESIITSISTMSLLSSCIEIDIMSFQYMKRAKTWWI